jgi:hypothetical protein
MEADAKLRGNSILVTNKIEEMWYQYIHNHIFPNLIQLVLWYHNKADPFTKLTTAKADTLLKQDAQLGTTDVPYVMKVLNAFVTLQMQRGEEAKDAIIRNIVVKTDKLVNEIEHLKVQFTKYIYKYIKIS